MCIIQLIIEHITYITHTIHTVILPTLYRQLIILLVYIYCVFIKNMFQDELLFCCCRFWTVLRRRVFGVGVHLCSLVKWSSLTTTSNSTEWGHAALPQLDQKQFSAVITGINELFLIITAPLW